MVADTALELPVITHKWPARRISWQDAEAIAQQVAKRLTESEAALNIGIDPKRWFRFKQRVLDQDKYDILLTRMRAAQIKAHIENIESFEAKDWRASDRLLQIKCPERFNDRQPQHHDHQPAINLTLIMNTLEKVYAGQVMDADPVKALPAPVQATPAPAGDIARLPQKTDDIDNR